MNADGGDLDLPSYPKTSGATGLHILIPLGARYTYDEVRTFARLLAVLGVEAAPDISTIARPLRAREGKVYIDFGQNGHGSWRHSLCGRCLARRLRARSRGAR